MGAPQVNYREGISKAAEIRYVHKKQSGGSGQFADIAVKFEPAEPGTGFEFKSDIKGGVVPKEYIPGVMKASPEIGSSVSKAPNVWGEGCVGGGQATPGPARRSPRCCWPAARLLLLCDWIRLSPPDAAARPARRIPAPPPHPAAPPTLAPHAQGLEEMMGSGSLAGFPVVDVRATLYDGSYHDVDSSVLAFQIAARQCFR